LELRSLNALLKAVASQEGFQEADCDSWMPGNSAGDLFGMVKT